MKENISIERVNHLSSCLSKGLIKTLELGNGSKVFAGNEEKLFILHILQHINNRDLDFNKEVLSSYKNGELATFFDIFSNEIKSRRNFLKIHSLLGSINQFPVNLESKTHIYYPFLVKDENLRFKLIEKKIIQSYPMETHN